jgi:hypothetical protein
MFPPLYFALEVRITEDGHVSSGTSGQLTHGIFADGTRSTTVVAVSSTKGIRVYTMPEIHSWRFVSESDFFNCFQI